MIATSSIEILAVPGIPEIQPGTALAPILIDALRENGITLLDGDVLVLAQKIVSKSENRRIHRRNVVPSDRAKELAAKLGKDPAKVEVILGETARVIAAEWPEGKPEGVLICEHRLGFISANAGVDESNTGEPDTFILLPLDPDASAREIRRSLEEEFSARIAVVIIDSFGRPWRLGIVNVAIGLSGLNPVIDLRGQADADGRTMTATTIAIADEIAAAAGLAMGKSNAMPAVIVRGLDGHLGEGRASLLLRAEKEDIFK